MQIAPQTTAGIDPEKIAPDLFFAQNWRASAFILAVFLIVGFALRVNQLGAESLSEDELNKLQTIQDYRENGLTGRNGEHPFLMKGLQMLSVIAAEKINNSISGPQSKISDEAALRFPLVLAGTFTTLLIFLLVSELFGRSIGLISAVLWAVEPMAIGFDRIAKEDGLVLFFFLLTNLFWVRGQTAAERGKPNWMWHAWAAAISFAALMASKYYPFLLAVTSSYYSIFQRITRQKWALGHVRWVKFFIVMGIAFLLLNPTIMLPDTWREMLKFSSENSIAHDSYEFLGHFYRNQPSYWLAGMPWTFFYVLIAVKSSLSTLLLFLAGIPLMFKRRLGDGRFFIFFWAFFWFMPFTVLGGKFTRYFAVAEPLILISAAVFVYYSVRWLSKRFDGKPTLAAAFQIAVLVIVIAFPLFDSIQAAPHFRLFTNVIGASLAPVGTYFPHDEFYDASTREIVADIAARARPNAVVACETPSLYEYYAGKTVRHDLKFVSFSDKSKVAALMPGDIIVSVTGRQYLSNKAYIDYLVNSMNPIAETRIMGITSGEIYQLDANTAAGVRSIASK